MRAFPLYDMPLAWQVLPVEEEEPAEGDALPFRELMLMHLTLDHWKRAAEGAHGLGMIVPAHSLWAVLCAVVM